MSSVVSVADASASSPSGQLLAEIARTYGTPVWVYDAARIRRQIDRLREFDVVRYAQKAASNVHLLRLLKAQGAVVDSVSAGEIERALAAGYEPTGEPAPIVYTADVFDRTALARVCELEIPVNAGSLQMVTQLGERSPGHAVWFRVNPGFGHGHSRKTNTGGEHSKHGLWHEDLDGALAAVDDYGLRLVGLHMHIGSGVDYVHLERVGATMVELVERLGRDVQAISAGGGLSVPYHSGEPEVDTARYFCTWDAARREIERIVGHAVALEIEPGRFLVAQSGVLVSEVRAHKAMGANNFVLIDAGFNDLMRPAMYGSEHRISALRPDGAPVEGRQQPTLVAGPLCESGDVFTQDSLSQTRPVDLPTAKVGDLLVFHDVGAYGAAMSSNYNSRVHAVEVLVDDRVPHVIRRRQRIEELLALEDVE